MRLLRRKPRPNPFPPHPRGGWGQPVPPRPMPPFSEPRFDLPALPAGTPVVDGEAVGGFAPRPSMWRTARRLLWRHRRLLAPFAVLVAVWLLGHLDLLGVLGWAVGFGSWGLIRGVRRLNRRVERRYAATCGAAGLVWLVWAALAGAGAVDEWLVVGWAVLSLPWWFHHRPRPALVEPEAPPAVETIPDRWEKYVAAAGGPVPGATLMDPSTTVHADVWAVQMVPGKQQLKTLMQALPLISTGLDVPMERLVVDGPHPNYPNRPSIARFQVVARSPIKDTVFFDEPRWDGGSVLLGPHADGDGEARWRVYSGKSMWGGFILGSSGSGKSRLLESLAVSVRAMSAAGWPTVIIYIDGQDGASSPMLWQHATWRAGPSRLGDVMAGLRRALEVRQQWNRLFGLTGFRPGFAPKGAKFGLPGVLVIVDECHEVFTPDAAPEWAKYAREGRKVGLAVVGASQYNDLAVFGGSDPLRSSLLAGNGLAMRTMSRTSRGLVPGLDVIDPAELPDLPGYGYKIAAPGSGERTAPFRGRYLPDLDDVEADPDIPVPTVEEWFAKTSDAELDPMTAAAFGEAFARRDDYDAAELEIARAAVEGRDPDPAVTAVIDLYTKAAKPAPALPAAPTEEGAASEAEVKTTRDAVLARLAEGPAAMKDLEEHAKATVGTTRSAVKSVVQDLLAKEVVRRPAHGRYELVRVETPVG